MSGGPVCQCSGSIDDKMKNWRIIQYMCNRSAFNGYHYTPSDYSAIRCLKCHSIWRTKANYVESLKKQNENT